MQKIIRAIGLLQFRYPLLKRIIQVCAARYANRTGTIRYGAGAGLRFNAKGGNAGYLFGTTEPEEQECLSNLLRPGDTFYDLGANVGFYAVIAGRLVGETGSVVAFEPFPASAEQIAVNARLNRFKHISVQQCAVSDRNDTMRLRTTLDSRNYKLTDTANEDTIEVPTVRLDDFVKRPSIRPPDVVMIDVEGAEIEVLQGMSGILREHRPKIICEVHWLDERFAAFCEEHLAPLGYTVTTLDGGALPSGDIRYHALLLPNLS